MTDKKILLPAEGKGLPTTPILGIPFFTGAIDDAVARAMAGGLVVAPSGPGLAGDLVRSTAYRDSVCTADLALTDSGFMVMLWRLFTGRKIPRHSGLKFIRAVLDRPELKEPGAIFWVMPSLEDDLKNREWLIANGFQVTEDDVYLAPRYGPGEIEDRELVQRIDARRPKIVMLAIGGGVQERLGYGLRKDLACRPGILCLGAAIAFLSGAQTAIPVWADRWRIGWLLRILSSPKRYLPRYVDALNLVPVLWKYRERVPGRDLGR